MVGKSSMKIIYKNGYQNGSIFEDGLTMLFNSDILAETWGRPIQDPWCGSDENPYNAGNVERISYSLDIAWKRTQDHSKWAIPLSEK